MPFPIALPRFSTASFLMVCMSIPFLTGCAHEVLNVPDHSQMVGAVHVDQFYRLQNKTGIHVLSGQDETPTIDLWYVTTNLKPADAFQRIPFPIDSPAADTTGDNTGELAISTPIAVTSVQIYQNCHVYIGRVAGGDLTNVHLLLVVPHGDTMVPKLAELQQQDMRYLSPIDISATRPATTFK